MTMRKFYASLAVMGLVAVVGCNTSATGGGGMRATGPQSTSPKARPPEGTGGTFKLSAPATSTEVKHGQTKDVKIGISKGKDFKENINFTTEVEPADKGVTAEMEKKTWTPSEPEEVMVRVAATDKAAEGNYKVKVTATPAEGKPTDVIFEVKVPAKK